MKKPPYKCPYLGGAGRDLLEGGQIVLLVDAHGAPAAESCDFRWGLRLLRRNRVGGVDPAADAVES
jgi:hypothetical protein